MVGVFGAYHDGYIDVIRFFLDTGIYGKYSYVHFRKSSGYIGKKCDGVMSVDIEKCFKACLGALTRLALPVRAYPAVGAFGI